MASSSDHGWIDNVVTMKDGKPALRWFPKCIGCGTQAALVGKKLWYRPTANHEWSLVLPACVAKETRRDLGMSAAFETVYGGETE